MSRLVGGLEHKCLMAVCLERISVDMSRRYEHVNMDTFSAFALRLANLPE